MTSRDKIKLPHLNLPKAGRLVESHSREPFSPYQRVNDADGKQVILDTERWIHLLEKRRRVKAHTPIPSPKESVSFKDTDKKKSVHSSHTNSRGLVESSSLPLLKRETSNTPSITSLCKPSSILLYEKSRAIIHTSINKSIQRVNNQNNNMVVFINYPRINKHINKSQTNTDSSKITS